MKKSDRRGGKRAGAGRPAITPAEKSVTVAICLHPDLLAYVDDLAAKTVFSRSAIISMLIRDAMKTEKYSP